LRGTAPRRLHGHINDEFAGYRAVIDSGRYNRRDVSPAESALHGAGHADAHPDVARRRMVSLFAHDFLNGISMNDRIQPSRECAKITLPPRGKEKEHGQAEKSQAQHQVTVFADLSPPAFECHIFATPRLRLHGGVGLSSRVTPRWSIRQEIKTPKRSKNYLAIGLRSGNISQPIV
jgi:hypothetical protein